MKEDIDIYAKYRNPVFGPEDEPELEFEGIGHILYDETYFGYRHKETDTLVEGFTTLEEAIEELNMTHMEYIEGLRDQLHWTKIKLGEEAKRLRKIKRREKSLANKGARTCPDARSKTAKAF